MAKAAVLLPGSIPFENVRDAIRQYPNIQPIYIEQISNAAVKSTAERLIAQGCDLFVARGLQAEMIQEITDLPVVPLRITAQEIALMVRQIQKDLNRTDITVSLIGYQNMYSDVSHFPKLFGINIRKHYVNTIEEMDEALRQSVEEHADAVIGGRHCCQIAGTFGIPAYFASGGTEGLSETLMMAQQIAEQIDTERRDAAELNAMFENNFNGILQVDMDGRILKANRVMMGIFAEEPEEIIGRHIQELIPELKEIPHTDMNETVSAMILYRNVSYAVSIMPVGVENKATGAILTFQEGRRIRQLDQELRRELTRRGHIASETFERNQWESESMRMIVRTARQIAGYGTSVLLTGERGVEKSILAECIHNASIQRDNSFIEIECSGYAPEKIDEMLFGRDTERNERPCLAELAQDGTLYLKNVERLSPESQYKLRSLINGRRLTNTSGQFINANVRVIAATETDLSALIEEGKFRNDLYYELSTVKLDLKPLRERPEDVRMYIQTYTEYYQKQYDKFVHLTAEARDLLTGYAWPGNLPQLRNVCQRIVLLAVKRDADGEYVRRLLEHTFITPKQEKEPELPYKDRKAAEIIKLLQKYHGRREKVAEDLGISKTTLWRYMKKYGIED